MSESHRRTGRGATSALLPALIAATAFGLPSSAQPAFEAVYGGVTSSEVGARGAAPVEYCLGGGFVAAGTSTPASGTSDAYVVRTGVNGARLWEFRYDLGGNESSAALVELRNGTGFVVAGTTDAAGDRDIFLLKLNCAGGVAWARTYGSADARHEIAADLAQARTGNPLAGTHAGDLVVAGTTQTADGADSDAFLLRTRVNGAPVWDRRYRSAGTQQSLGGLTEALRRAGTPTGDIVATGTASLGLPPIYGYSLRVGGDDGEFTHFDHCAAGYTVDGLDEGASFEAVVELTTPPHRGQLVMVGRAASITPPVAMLLRSARNPCVPLATRRFMSHATPGLALTLGRDVAEVRSGASPGQLLLASGLLRFGPPPLPFSAALLSAIDPTTLAPLPGRSSTYGRQADVASLAIHASGVVLAGTSRDDPQGVGDPSDLFIVNTDTLGLTGCSDTFELESEPWPLIERVFTLSAAPFLTSAPRPVTRRGQNTGFVSCP